MIYSSSNIVKRGGSLVGLPLLYLRKMNNRTGAVVERARQAEEAVERYCRRDVFNMGQTSQTTT